ncbi:hypothetical protein K492DRAFT_192712 [Lichtheimia hyalospora FSU 10163]|nr:hypothetical protein K492DRAFT_192712 [Lichtheimia hyalospora FSU 10163]
MDDEQDTNLRSGSMYSSSITIGSYESDEEEYPAYWYIQDLSAPADESDQSMSTVEHLSDSNEDSADEENSTDHMSVDDNINGDHPNQDNDSLISSLCDRITRLLQVIKSSSDR